MFTDFGFQVCDKIYHLISQHFNPTFIEITCAELHEKLEVAATEEQIKNCLPVRSSEGAQAGRVEKKEK